MTHINFSVTYVPEHDMEGAPLFQEHFSSSAPAFPSWTLYCGKYWDYFKFFIHTVAF